jgi:hypothetical protein
MRGAECFAVYLWRGWCFFSTSRRLRLRLLLLGLRLLLQLLLLRLITRFRRVRGKVECLPVLDECVRTQPEAVSFFVGNVALEHRDVLEDFGQLGRLSMRALNFREALQGRRGRTTSHSALWSKVSISVRRASMDCGSCHPKSNWCAPGDSQRTSSESGFFDKKAFCSWCRHRVHWAMPSREDMAGVVGVCAGRSARSDLSSAAVGADTRFLVKALWVLGEADSAGALPGSYSSSWNETRRRLAGLSLPPDSSARFRPGFACRSLACSIL